MLCLCFIFNVVFILDILKLLYVDGLFFCFNIYAVVSPLIYIRHHNYCKFFSNIIFKFLYYDNNGKVTDCTSCSHFFFYLKIVILVICISEGVIYIKSYFF